MNIACHCVTDLRSLKAYIALHDGDEIVIPHAIWHRVFPDTDIGDLEELGFDVLHGVSNYFYRKYVYYKGVKIKIINSHGEEMYYSQ